MGEDRERIIYVCCPYSHEDPPMLEYRFHKVTQLVSRLMEKYPDCTFFSPITHSHPISKYMGNQLDAGHWLKQDLVFLRVSNIIFVYTLDGWKDSSGINDEYYEACRCDKPVFYVDDSIIPKDEKGRVFYYGSNDE